MDRLVVVISLLMLFEGCASYEILLADKLKSKYKEGESKVQCKVVDFYSNVKEEKLPFQRVKINFCAGTCKSSYVAKSPNSSLLCLSNCIPTKTVKRTVPLNGNSSLTYTEVKACSCSKLNCREKSHANP